MKLPGIQRICAALIVLFCLTDLAGEDGYRLWLRYDPVKDTSMLKVYQTNLSVVNITGNSETIRVIREELSEGLSGLLGKKIPFVSQVQGSGTLLIGVPASSPEIAALHLSEDLAKAGREGFLLRSCRIAGHGCIVLTANSDQGLLYGTFHLLRLIQTCKDITHLDTVSAPRVQYRLLNHWDNLNRTVERGYAGFSIWNWHLLPDVLPWRYKEYARANASIGINGTVLTNVNANAMALTPEYLEKVKALADIFRPYGVKVYLTARFSAPVEIGGLKTADPLDSAVIGWWNAKIREIYSYIPDFGGFLVKANSEGQPGPQNYGRNHADGANILARALEPFGGIVMWRAFVYDNNVPEDRAKQAYNEFKPLDGLFMKNVLVQVKNGPIDFQPREPFHPLFGAMPQTPLMMEFQITQEYLGQGTHLAYLAPLFKECLDADTYAKGKNSTVDKIIDGSLEDHRISGMAGVSNIGDDRNWCGHHFAQSNWYAFGRLAWDHSLASETIAEEWIRMTFSNDKRVIMPLKEIMMSSRETIVNYMTPLGLHHIMAVNNHYGPGPWVDQGRPDWTSVYYHKADSAGLGFDRSSSGSNAVSQYFPEVRMMFESLDSCPENMLLWFHHVDWNYRLKSGQTLWDELCYRYYQGAETVKMWQKQWKSLEGMIDRERYEYVASMLSVQAKEAIWWRNACVLYFQTFSGLPIPGELEKPDQTLEYYKKIKHPYAPGI